MSASKRQRSGWPPCKRLSQMTDAEYADWFSRSDGHLPASAAYSEARLVRRVARDAAKPKAR